MKENYFFHSDLKVVLVVVVLECFAFFLMGLIDLNDSAIFFFFLSIFQKIRVCLKI